MPLWLYQCTGCIVNKLCFSLFQTFGISSSDSSVAQESTDSSQRSHESAPGQNVEGIIGASSKNYFQQFLSCGKE